MHPARRRTNRPVALPQLAGQLGGVVKCATAAPYAGRGRSSRRGVRRIANAILPSKRDVDRVGECGINRARRSRDGRSFEVHGSRQPGIPRLRRRRGVFAFGRQRGSRRGRGRCERSGCELLHERPRYVPFVRTQVRRRKMREGVRALRSLFDRSILRTKNEIRFERDLPQRRTQRGGCVFRHGRRRVRRRTRVRARRMPPHLHPIQHLLRRFQAVHSRPNVLVVRYLPEGPLERR